MADLSKTEIQVNSDIKLIALKKDQVNDLVSILTDRENLEFVGKFPDWPNNPNLKQKIVGWIEESIKGTFLPLVISYRGEIAGVSRLIDIDYDHEKVEFGYILLPKYIKKGIASASVKAMLDFSFDTLKLNRVELKIDSRNEESIKLAKRLNFTYEGTLREDYKYKHSQPGVYSNGQVWSILKSEYKS